MMPIMAENNIDNEVYASGMNEKFTNITSARKQSKGNLLRYE